MSYFENRQNPLTDLPAEKMEAAFKAICEYFEKAWLCQKSGTHVLQRLWQRKDALATNELFTLGSSLFALEKIDPSWLKNQIRLIKQRDENNQKGALFEIIAIGCMCSKQKVIPAKQNQKGYDVDVQMEDLTCLRISLKAYAESSHERSFRKRMEIARNKFINAASSSIFHAKILVSASKYPSENDWQVLYSSLIKMASQFQGTQLVEQIPDCWTLVVMPLQPEKGERFATSRMSHSFIGHVPFHTNEQKNFISKLETAVANLEKHVLSGSNIHPVVFIQLPATASTQALQKWTDQYFVDNPNTKLDSVVFIQPYMSGNTERTTNFIAYYIKCSSSIRFIKSEKSTPVFEIPVGIITPFPPLWQLNSASQAIPIENQYVYQRGEHYTLLRRVDSGAEGNITRKAPGIYTNLLLEDNVHTPALAGIWGENLCIIGN